MIFMRLFLELSLMRSRVRSEDLVLRSPMIIPRLGLAIVIDNHMQLVPIVKIGLLHLDCLGTSCPQYLLRMGATWHLPSLEWWTRDDGPIATPPVAFAIAGLRS